MGIFGDCSTLCFVIACGNPWNGTWVRTPAEALREPKIKVARNGKLTGEGRMTLVENGKA